MASARGSRNTTSYKIPDPLPRMVSETDVVHVSRVAEALPSGAVAVEFGPWLGALSEVIAGHADLHVVDRFEWTKDHAKRVPELLKPGESFRGVLEQVLAERGLSATIHETAFDAFQWSGGEIALVLIDGPKKSRDLAECLRTVIGSLGPGARVIVKNAFHPKHWELLPLLERLVAEGALSLTGEPVAAAVNMMELVAGPNSEHGASILENAQVTLPATAGFLDRAGLGTDHPYRVAAPLHFLGAGNFTAAYDVLSAMKPDRHLRKAWTKHAPTAAGTDPARVFADVFAIHHTAVARTLPEPFGSSSERLLRGAWLNMADKPDRAQRFHPDLFEQARLYGYMGWPHKVRAVVRGQDILDVGCGPGLHGLGYLAAGASSYLGVDPIIRTDRDRVKNLSAGGKMPFGWTPDEISARVPAWDVLPIGIEDLPDDRTFDLVVLHNVTEHLPDIEAAFEGIARVLRRGGHLLYNHDNFYSWNGHHCPPKKVEDIDPSDHAQRELIDWGHITFDPPPGHYIGRGLNRIRLDDLITLTERHFTIVQSEEVPSSKATGIDRLTDEILARHSDFSRRDLATKNLFCLARKD